jgi:hypothetical protein
MSKNHNEGNTKKDLGQKIKSTYIIIDIVKKVLDI